MAKYTYIDEPLSTEEGQRFDQERRREHGVSALPGGFTLKSDGRDGMLYYREGEHILEMYWEIDAGGGISIFIEGLDTWVLPKMETTSPDDRKRLREALGHWVRQQRGPITLLKPEDLVRPQGERT